MKNEVATVLSDPPCIAEIFFSAGYWISGLGLKTALVSAWTAIFCVISIVPCISYGTIRESIIIGLFPLLSVNFSL